MFLWTMRKRLSIPVLFFPASLLAQDTCSCSSNLDRYIDLVTRNYSGFRDKVAPGNQAEYQVLLDSLRYVASITSDKTLCFGVLDTYRTFFYDKHLQLGGPYAPSANDGVAGSPPITTDWTAATLKTYFKAHDKDLRSLEGVWVLDAYEVGIVHDSTSNAFQAVITKAANSNWKEGMVKFTLPELEGDRAMVHYRRGDMSLSEVSTRLVQDHLVMDGIGTWRKVLPAPKEPIDERTFELTYGSEVQWKLVDDSTLYIKLGSCDLKNKAVLDSLVSANKSLLDRIPNWVVDFRDNGGGSTDVFQCLLPYLYTKPLKEYGVSHWMSPENTMVLKDFLRENKKMMEATSAREVERLVEHGEKHPNTWHIGNGSTTRFKKHDMPRRIAILANRYTASSGESFVEIARGMSSRSVIFGENTGGFMDYGDVMPHDLGCDGLGAAVPTSRMNRLDHGLAYDKEGITPDVRISSEETDWIRYVRTYWVQHAFVR